MATLRGVSDTGKALEQLDGGCQGNPLPDALFELSDLELQSVESVDLLCDAAPGFRGKPRNGCLKPGPAGAGEDVAGLGAGNAVLGQGSVDAVLQGGAELGERHRSCRLIGHPA